MPSSFQYCRGDEEENAFVKHILLKNRKDFNKFKP
mgnify:CR=1 FL=1